MLNIQGGLFYIPKDKKLYAESIVNSFTAKEGDHLTLLNVWKQVFLY